MLVNGCFKVTKRWATEEAHLPYLFLESLDRLARLFSRPLLCAKLCLQRGDPSLSYRSRRRRDMKVAAQLADCVERAMLELREHFFGSGSRQFHLVSLARELVVRVPGGAQRARRGLGRGQAVRVIQLERLVVGL